MEPGLQSKLLKLLEDRTVRRLGSTREREVDVRFVAATHRPLEKLVAEGGFRADLFYRLSVVQVQVPPLRERPEDIEPLATHFLATHGRRYGRPGLGLSQEAAALLRAHAWPGNVRELRNAMEQATLAAATDRIGMQDLGLVMRQTAPIARETQAPQTLPDLERETIIAALERSGGNVSRAARRAEFRGEGHLHQPAEHPARRAGGDRALRPARAADGPGAVQGIRQRIHWRVEPAAG